MTGLAIAFYVYILKEGMGARIAARRGPMWTFLYNKWFFDELYDAVFVKGAKALGDFFWKIGDVKIIDGLGPNGAAWASLKSGGWLSRFQSGFVYFYAFVMLIGVAAFLAFAIFTWGA
jgi:NADH-quinone oxidoreductase subunit L